MAMRAVHWLMVVVTCVPACAQVTLQAADLAPARNQISNCSFEASVQHPVSFEVASGAPSVQLSSEAMHGTTSLQLSVPAGGEPTLVRQDVPGCAWCRYELSGWVRVAADQGGTSALALEAFGRGREPAARQEALVTGSVSPWRRVAVELTTPAETEFVRVVLSARAGITVQWDALRLQIISGPRRRSYGPHLRDLRADRIEATWVLLRWRGSREDCEIAYRQKRWPRQVWATTDASGPAHSLVGLRQDTSYEVRVRLKWPQFYDEQGQAVAAPVTPEAPAPLSLKTAAWAPRVVGLLRIWPMAPLHTMAGPAARPRLDSWREHLYVAQQYAGSIILSKLPPTTLVAAWTMQLVPSNADGSPALLEDIAVVGDTLYVLYRRGPQELVIQSMSLETEEIGPPVGFAPVATPARLGSAALAAYRGGLWVLWLEQIGTGPGERGLIHVGLWDPGAAQLSKTLAWHNAATSDPTDPSLGVFGDELIIPFADGLAETRQPGYQPLYLISCDGIRFGGWRKMRDLGRNLQPRGAQLGPAYYLVYASDAVYTTFGGRYRDLMLSTIPPNRLGLETVTLLDDRKFNVSVDITTLGNSLWTVHEKLDHAPTESGAAPQSYGVFIGRIDLGEPPPEPSHRPQGTPGAPPVAEPAPTPTSPTPTPAPVTS